MQEQMCLIDCFPWVLADIPNFIQEIERYCGWNMDRKPSEILNTWHEQDNKIRFYFLGWLKEAVARLGMGAVIYLRLKEKQALAGFIKEILKEASEEDLGHYERGIRESSI